LTAGNPVLSRAAAHPSSGPRPDERPRLLLIDDEEEAWLICKAHLEHHSPNMYVLSWARTFDAGLDAAVRNQHDLYIVDVFLGSGPTGIELIERARASGNRAPMIVLTRYANPALDQRSLVAGSTDYLDKSEITGPLFERTIRYALERARSERRVRASEALYRSLFKHNPHLVFGLAPDGRFLLANPAFERLVGRSGTELTGVPFSAVVAPEHVGVAARVLADAIAHGPESFELLVRAADGTPSLIEGSCVPLHIDHELVGVYVFAEDTQARRRTEERIRFQAALLDAVGQAVVATDPEGRIQYWNEAAARLYGWTSEEVLGRPVVDVLGADPGLSDPQPADTWSGELRLRRKDGSEFPTYVTQSPIRDARGDLVSVVRICSDLTERKDLETQLLQSTKLEAVGRLAGGVAHDFNNILTTILGFSQLALDELDDHPDVLGYISETLRSARRAQDLTRQLLAFSRQQLLKPQVIDLGDTIKDMERMLRRTLGEDIELVVEADADAGWVRADPGQAEQVVLNLALNARDAMPQGGRLIISTAPTTLHAHSAWDSAFAVKPGEYVRLTVSDTGHGMEADVLSRVFDPFFTTKHDRGGTGLGLAMVYGIVKQSEGYIRAFSKAGRGSTFEVYLPRVAKAVPTEVQPGQVRTPPGGRGRVVLVVEDEDAVRAMVCRVLERSGYEVIDAADGSRALDLAREARDRLALILSDVVMPGMSGREVVERLAAEDIRPSVIYMSGYTRDEMIRKGLQEASFTFLPKPFLPAELLSIVAEELAAEV
jgi:two-component system, cell cycle sensor histidine kinase and response regulator CckA